MEMINVNYSKIIGRMKPMNAVNNGPVNSDVEQIRSNFEAYKEARFPYARTHDASFCAEYGGEHCVDVHAIFPDFSKNPYNPDSYDFTLTDDYLNSISKSGTKIFYRLGSKIEHWRKKYGTIVPADFKKWAVICEHIIRHYNLGWADGFNLNIEYWEIWNEPDGKKSNGDQPNWSGTPEQFYEFYKTAALHLKKCFPELKIGGPALSWAENEEWLDGFLMSLTENGKKVPLDFFSWHAYIHSPEAIVKETEFVRKKLDDAGYCDTETNLNEWNYLENWTDKFVSSIEAIIGMRGAAISAAAMITGQKSPLDMMMYYDARPGCFNGLFDFYTLRRLKGYYPFFCYSKLYELGNETESSSTDKELYVLSATDEVKKELMVAYYSEKEDAEEKEFILDISGECVDGEWRMKILDNERTMCESKIILKDGKICVKIKPDTVMFIEK